MREATNLVGLHANRLEINKENGVPNEGRKKISTLSRALLAEAKRNYHAAKLLKWNPFFLQWWPSRQPLKQTNEK